VARAEAYLHARFHLDPSNRLATVHERYRQTGQQTDSIGQTVLQTVAQNGTNGHPGRSVVFSGYVVKNPDCPRKSGTDGHLI